MLYEVITPVGMVTAVPGDAVSPREAVHEHGIEDFHEPSILLSPSNINFRYIKSDRAIPSADQGPYTSSITRRDRMNTVAGIDMGTQSIKVVLYDWERKAIVARSQVPVDIIARNDSYNFV